MENAIRTECTARVARISCADPRAYLSLSEVRDGVAAFRETHLPVRLA